MSNGDEKPRTNANTSAGTQKRRVHHRAAASSSSCEEPILHRQHPSKIAEYELQIIAQPETQHRARYLTEGSRGPVKDVSQQGYPQIQVSTMHFHCHFLLYFFTETFYDLSFFRRVLIFRNVFTASRIRRSTSSSSLCRY